MAEGGGEKQATGDAGTADVFISYATADKSAADSIRAALERDGIVCWIAPRDVTPGVFYADAIVQAINSARILIVVLSVNSAGSQHVLREVERASAKRRPLVAFRLDTTSLPTGLEYFLSASHWRMRAEARSNVRCRPCGCCASAFGPRREGGDRYQHTRRLECQRERRCRGNKAGHAKATPESVVDRSGGDGGRAACTSRRQILVEGAD